MQTPENHWCLKRREPPRLPPGVDGYYYNFATDTVADDVSYILRLGDGLGMEWATKATKEAMSM